VIDLHCHILPGLDDGPADLAHSIEMAHQAEADGIELICATPHIRHDHDVRIDELPGRVADLNAAAAEAGCRTRITTGGEVAETIVEQLSDLELQAVSLGGGGRWILLEPKSGPLSDSLDHAVVTLRMRGFRSLIAHPERHLCRDMFERLGRLTREGALIQATAATMCEPPASRGMRQLAAAGVVHVLASDSHHPRHGREVAISDGLAALAAVDLVAPHAEWVTTTAPRAIVAGSDIGPPFAPTV
jgi:protein-tyrosine phosphatase